MDAGYSKEFNGTESRTIIEWRATKDDLDFLALGQVSEFHRSQPYDTFPPIYSAYIRFKIRPMILTVDVRGSK